MIVKINGTDIFYEKIGEGPPLILIHGNGETHDIFDKSAALLSDYFTVYLPDTRGHGQSMAVEEFHYDDMAEDFRAFIEHEQLEAPMICGFSDGGIIALILASRYPRLLSRAFVCGANLNPDGMKKGWLRFFRMIYRITKDSKVRVIIEEPDITDEMLGKIEIPIHIFAGGRDMIYTSHTKEIADKIKNSTLTIIPKASHGSYVVHNTDIANRIIGIYTADKIEECRNSD